MVMCSYPRNPSASPAGGLLFSRVTRKKWFMYEKEIAKVAKHISRAGDNPQEIERVVRAWVERLAETIRLDIMKQKENDIND